MSPARGPAWQDPVLFPDAWGRVRYRVVGAVLERWCAQLGPAPLRVLDAGGGDGRDAVGLALAGHDVTVLDTDPHALGVARGAADAAGVGDHLRTVPADLEDLTALAALTGHRRGGSGSFDVVLCHDVLQHRGTRAQVRTDVAALASSLRPGGVLSLLLPVPAADVVGAVLRGSPVDAWAVLDAASAPDPAGGREVLRLRPEEVDAALEAAGCDVVEHAGVLAVTTLLEDAGRVERRSADDLAELELELSARAEFRSTSRYLLTAGRRRGDAAPPGR